MSTQIRRREFIIALTTAVAGHKEAAELAGSRPEAILVEGTPAVAAMRQLAPSVPLVFVMVGDPVGSGVVNSFAHPGGTITGFSNFEPSMGGKWLEVLKEAVPAIKTVGVLAYTDQQSHMNYWHSAEAAARILDVGVEPIGPALS
jgi:putative tryptophan/tyrosine transport system substrate-binding protein